MGKILFFLALLAVLFIYYFRPVSLEPQKPAEVKQEEVKKETPKPVVKKVVKPEPKQEENQIIEVDTAAVAKPLPVLSGIITTTKNHPYADPDKYPLHYAICKGDMELIKQSFKNEDLVNEQGEVVIGTKECYCEQNKYEICTCDETLIMPPLNLAVLKRNEEVAKYLLRRKANPLVKDELGRNALDIAQQQRMANLQDLLIKYVK